MTSNQILEWVDCHAAEIIWFENQTNGLRTCCIYAIGIRGGIMATTIQEAVERAALELNKRAH